MMLKAFLDNLLTWLVISDSSKKHSQHINVEEYKELEKKYQELQEQNRLKEYALEVADLGYWDWYPQTKGHFVSKRWLDILGLEPSEIMNTEADWLDRIHPDDKLYTMLLVDQAIAEKQHYKLEFRMRHKDGHYIWILGSGSPLLYDDAGNVTRVSGTHQDITDKKELEKEFEKHRNYMKTLYDLNPNIIMISDGKELNSANHAFFKLFDYVNIDEFKEQHHCVCNFFEYLEDDTYLHPSKGNWIDAASKEESKQALIIKGEETYNFSVISKKITFSDLPLYIVTMTDTTEYYKLQQQLIELSIMDELTQVYNRRYFNEISKKLISSTARSNAKLSFIMIDIDNFKNYNDNYGHDQGDSVLKNLAQIIANMHTRNADAVCRMGGEEFAVLTNYTEREVMLQHAQEICNQISSANMPHKYNMDFNKVTISLGVSCCDFSLEKKSMEQLYKEADEALYLSKHNGRNQVTLYQNDTNKG